MNIQHPLRDTKLSEEAESREAKNPPKRAGSHEKALAHTFPSTENLLSNLEKKFNTLLLSFPKRIHSNEKEKLIRMSPFPSVEIMKSRLSDSSEASNTSSLSNDSVEGEKSVSTSSLTNDTESNVSQNIRVVTRVRPLSDKELSEQSKECVVAKEEAKSIVVTKGNKTFDYDAVFGPKTSQQQVYEHTAGDLIRNNLFKGFNVTVLAYGQTGSGKTHTIFGGNGNSISKELNNDLDGIIPRAVHEVFGYMKHIARGEDRMKVSLSFLEIYNEEARDLLSSEACPPELNIRDSNGEVVVQGLSRHSVISAKEVSALMDSAAEKRSTAATMMNAVSSRSHAICTLYISIAPSSDQQGEEEEINAKLTLVDLAGSERAKKTGAEGARLKEGININKGLFVLGQVVSALSELGQQTGGSDNSSIHVKYRDSKLTRLLQDSLGGNSKTVMVACVSPSDSNSDETINTLRYAERTRNIKNSAVRNVVVTNISPAEAAALRRENQMLKLQLFQAQTKISSMSNITQPHSVLKPSNFVLSCNQSNLANVSEPKPLVDQTLASDELNGLDIHKLDVVTKLRLYCTSLEEKIQQQEMKAIQDVEESITMSFRADKWQHKCEILTEMLSSNGIEVPSELMKNQDDSDNNLVKKLRDEVMELKSQLHESNVNAEVLRAVAAAVVNGNGNIEIAENLAIASSQHDYESSGSKDSSVARNISVELMTMSGSIEEKEAMISQLSRERECMEAMRSHFECAIQSLQTEVETLSYEKNSLMERLKKSGSSDSDPQVKRLKERATQLESRIKELQMKSNEHARSLKLQSQAEKTIEKLEAEIKMDKKRRAELQRKLKEESIERRNDQQIARTNASRLLRDSQRLKMELSKVKEAASRQEAVLRRRAAEALAKQKMLEDKNRKRGRGSGIKVSTDVHSERKDQICCWFEREINNALVLQDLRGQIEENTSTLQEAEERRQLLNSQMLKGEENVIRALDAEIELRTSIIEQLERNVIEIYKSANRSPTAAEKSSCSFLETSFLKSLSSSEIRTVLLIFFDRLTSLQVEYDKMNTSLKSTLDNAVAKAISEQKRMAIKEITALKVKHSEDISGLLESAAKTVQRELYGKISDSNVNEEVKISLKSQLDDFIASCSSIGSKVKSDLDEIKSSQENMKKLVHGVAGEMISHNEAQALLALKKKPKKVKDPLPEPEDEDFDLEDDVDMGALEDSDDSDWAPDTPMPMKKKRKSIEGENIDTSETEINKIKVEGDKLESAVEDFEKMTVVELKDLLRKNGLTVGGKKSELIYRLRLNVRAKAMIAASVRKKKRTFSSDDIQKSGKKLKLDVTSTESFSPLPSTKTSKAGRRNLTTATKASLLRRKSPKAHASADVVSATPRGYSSSSRSAFSSKSATSSRIGKKANSKLPTHPKDAHSTKKRRSIDSACSSSSEAGSSVVTANSMIIGKSRAMIVKPTDKENQSTSLNSTSSTSRTERIRAATKKLNEIKSATKLNDEDSSVSSKKPPLSIITNSAKKRKINRREDMKRSVNQALEALGALENL